MSEKKGEYYEILNPVKSGESTFWHKIGVLFEHGEALTGEMFAAPLNGQIVVKKVRRKAEEISGKPVV